MDFTHEIVFGLLLLVVAIVLVSRRKNERDPEAFLSTPAPIQKPTLYWICDSSVNSRNWLDFGSRNTTKPNRGYLEIALDRVRRTQPEFEVVPLIGREAVMALLPGSPAQAFELPFKLWREWAIASILAAKGGLVMDGDSTLCIGPSLYPLVSMEAATFGVYPEEEIVAPLTAVAPGPAPYVGWSRLPNHPAWIVSAKFYYDLILRGQTAWSAAIARRANMTIWEKQKALGCVVLRGPDGGRLPNGKRRQLEDIFETKPNPWADILPGTVYISYDGEDLSRRYEFNWFLRLSPDQLRESHIVWAKLAGF